MNRRSRGFLKEVVRTVFRRRPMRRLRRAFGADPTFRLEARQLLAADVLTYHNDTFRTGQNLLETTLTLANVRVDQFGRVGQVKVDGAVYAQPLVKTGVDVPGLGMRDLVIVATQHDSVYAFDANTLEEVWQRTFIAPERGVTTVPAADQGDSSIFPEIGITSTPVIDPATNIVYFTAKTKEVSDGVVKYVYRLHALDLASGQDALGGPVVIAPQVRGRGLGSVKGVVSFNTLRQLQRPALLLSNGVVYAAFGSLGDVLPYSGWLVGFDARDLRQVQVFNTTPNGRQGGIWMSGGGPAADASGNIFVATGNGTLDGGNRPVNLGDSVVRLTRRPNGLVATSYFAPSDQASLEARDADFGSGGILLLPDQPGPTRRLLVTGGKDGRLYLLNRDQLGGFSPRGDRVTQMTRSISGLWATPAYFNGRIYVAGSGDIEQKRRDPILMFTLRKGRIAPRVARGGPIYGYPGTTPSISANGLADGIVWTLDNGPQETGGPAVLRAYDAANVSRELYDSTQAGARDQAGPAVKFTVPTVANGRVYVGGKGTLTMYGLLGPS